MSLQLRLAGATFVNCCMPCRVHPCLMSNAIVQSVALTKLAEILMPCLSYARQSFFSTTFKLLSYSIETHMPRVFAGEHDLCESSDFIALDMCSSSNGGTIRVRHRLFYYRPPLSVSACRLLVFSSSGGFFFFSISEAAANILVHTFHMHRACASEGLVVLGKKIRVHEG